MIDCYNAAKFLFPFKKRQNQTHIHDVKLRENYLFLVLNSK